MKEKISEEIKLPDGMDVEIEDYIIKIKKSGNEIQKKYSGIKIKREGDRIILYADKATKREFRLMKTTAAHIRNMIKGLQKNFIYRLQIASVHFPMNVKFDEGKREIVIKNFLGEVKDRKAKILPNVNVKIEKDVITLESFDKESAGQSASNVEKATKVRKKDRRIFQDGIYITEKAKGRLER